MDERERALMGEHLQYLGGHFAEGRVLAFGPVLDPQGSFGMAILEVADEAEARAFGDNDPTIRAGLHTYTLSPMKLGASQASRA